MTRATLVIEAATRSGSLITARLAAEQGRDVFAVPGHPLDPRAAGTNRLIKEGAIMITCAADILSELQPASAGTSTLAVTAPAPLRPAPPVTGLEDAAGNAEKVAAVLGPAPVNVDEISRATGLPARAVQVALLELALAGRIEHHGSQLVSLTG